MVPPPSDARTVGDVSVPTPMSGAPGTAHSDAPPQADATSADDFEGTGLPSGRPGELSGTSRHDGLARLCIPAGGNGWGAVAACVCDALGVEELCMIGSPTCGARAPR